MLSSIRSVRRYSLGCPSHSTHPHLLREDEIGLTPKIYEQRRAKLIAKLPLNSIAIIVGSGLKYRSNNIFDLNYFTGFNEPDAICVISRFLHTFNNHQEKEPLDSEAETFSAETKCHHMHLFLQPKTKSLEIWDGPRSGTQGALSYFHANAASPISDFPSYLSDTLINTPSPTHIYSNVLTTKDFDATRINFNTKCLTTNSDVAVFSSKFVTSKKHTTFHLSSLRMFIDSIRGVKDDSEVALMAKAAEISSHAFIDVLGILKPGVGENAISATLEYGIKIRGGTGFAYQPVVASGPNALILHYTLNQQITKAGELVLIDAGGEFGGFASDITRTFPISGTFTQPQREIYEAVLSANVECIKMCRNDCHVSLDNLHRAASSLLQSKLEKLFERSIKPREWDLIYPHFIGHYLGMDLHDCASLSRAAVLVAGNVITIEPGIYIPNSDDYPEEYRGIGVRIEDDVVIGDACDARVLSHLAPKTVRDIEQIMRTQETQH